MCCERRESGGDERNGVQEMGTGNKVDTNTLFMIGSNSKAFTGTALTMLDADKQLSDVNL